MWMLALLVALLLTPCGVWAQKATIQYDDVVIHSSRTVAHDGPSVPIDTSNTVSIEVNIASGTAEVLFRISGAGRYGWTPLYCTSSDSVVSGTSTTVSGLFTCNVAGGNAANFRLDTCTGCSVSAVVRKSTATVGGSGSGGGAAAGWPLTRVGNITFANSFVTSAGIGNGTDYWALYRDATNGLQFNCVISGTENACNYIRKLSATFFYEIQNSSGSSIFRVTNDTGRMTNTIVREERFWPVASVQNGVGSLIYDTPASNPAVAGTIVGTNVIRGVADFNDTTANSFQDEWILPAGFTGSIDVHFRWVAAATTGSVAWCAQLVRIAVSGSIDPAFPAVSTGNCVSDAANGSTNTENLATITGVTCTSCAAGDRVAVRISRDPAEVSTRTDTMTGNARLIEYGRVWDRVLQ